MVVSGSCSCAHQFELVLLPSIWCAAVAAPQRKPFGKSSVVMTGSFQWAFVSVLAHVSACS